MHVFSNLLIVSNVCVYCHCSELTIPAQHSRDYINTCHLYMIVKLLCKCNCNFTFIKSDRYVCCTADCYLYACNYVCRCSSRKI